MGTDLYSQGGFTQLYDPTQWDLSTEESNVAGQGTAIGISTRRTNRKQPAHRYHLELVCSSRKPQPAEPEPGPPSNVGDRQNDDGPVRLPQVGDGEREASQKKPSHGHLLAHARPEWPCDRSLRDPLHRARNFLYEVDPKTGALQLVPVARRRQVGGRAWVDADGHGLATPAAREQSAESDPVFGCDRPGAQLGGPLL